jgi:hypothetical protein
MELVIMFAFRGKDAQTGAWCDKGLCFPLQPILAATFLCVSSSNDATTTTDVCIRDHSFVTRCW